MQLVECRLGRDAGYQPAEKREPERSGFGRDLMGVSVN